MTRCKECGIKFPDDLISQGICGICALKISNEIHGTNREEFNGEMANKMLYGAREHLKFIKGA